jgi:transposase InsO family protein
MKFSNKKCEKCTTCIKGKQTSKLFSKVKGTRARDILGIVHTDICGPMCVPSWSGSKYFITLIDEKTRKTFVYFLKHKSEASNILKEFKAVAEKQSGKRIKIIRSDNAKEYVICR